MPGASRRIVGLLCMSLCTIQACGSDPESQPASCVFCDDAAPDSSADAPDSAPADAQSNDGADVSNTDAGPDAPLDAPPEAQSDSPNDSDVVPALGNALILADGTVTGLYRVGDPAAGARAVAFQSDGASTRCLDEKGNVIWEQPHGAGPLFGGFDFDDDGFPDLGIARSEDTGQVCGSTPLRRTWLDFVQGRTGAIHSPIAPTDAICWNFSGTIYPTDQWTVLGVLFGSGTSLLAATPYYATTGSLLSFGSGFTEVAPFNYPSTDAFDNSYTADLPNAHGAGHSYEQYSHVANGLIVNVAGEERLVFFTTARVVQYRLGPLGPDQLVADAPFLTANRTDLVGRNYGLVLPDPGDPSRLVLLSGTTADTVHSDMVTGTMAADPWGQIERHVTVYDLSSGTVLQDRFFSYAHDANDGHKYEGRVVAPDNPMVRTVSGPSRYAFNVYEGGHWMLHVTEPGSANDAVVFKDQFLWDIRDVDQDGLEEWVLSPSRDATDPDVPGWYFVKWRTVFAHWNEASLELDPLREEQGMIPYLAPLFRQPAKTSSRGYLYPVLTTEQGGELVLLMWSSTGALLTIPSTMP